LSPPTFVSSGFRYVEPSPLVDPNNKYIGFEGSRSRDAGLLEGVQYWRFPSKQPFYPMDRMEQTIDIVDTFYSEAGGLGLHNSAIFSKVCTGS
jgi:hypothetical protein